MSIVLEDSTKETLSKASLEQSSSMLKGATSVTPYESADENNATVVTAYRAIEGGAEALAAVPAIATEITLQIIENVSVYAAVKLKEAMKKIIKPPTPDEIFGKAGEEMSKFLKSAGKIIEELSSDAEQQNSDDAKKKQLEAINEKANKQVEKINALNDRIKNIVGNVEKQCKNLQKYLTQGAPWAEKNANEIEEKAKNKIDEIINAQVDKILKDKKDFIDGMADGIAKRTADEANEALKKITKEKLDKINISKIKVEILATAKVGKALLNLMATLGL